MLNIRLQRVGRKNDPSFRVIVADSKLKPKTGNVIENLGSYNARQGKPVINIARAKYWMSVGAKASGTVHNLLVDLKAVTGKKINVLSKKTPIVKEQVVAEAPKVVVSVVSPKVVAPVTEKLEEVVSEVAVAEDVASELVVEKVVSEIPVVEEKLVAEVVA